MKMMQKSLLALAVLATTAIHAQAASNVEVKVIGRIDPGTCTPTLSGGGTVDYGTMSPSVLAASGYTLLPAKQLDFAITCTAPSKVAVQAFNGRPGTLAGASEAASGAGRSPINLFSTTAVGAVGLGTSGNANVGGYGVEIDPATVTVDGNSVVALRKTESVTAWTNDNYANFLYDPYYTRLVTWGTTGSTTPVAFTNLTGKLNVQAFINEKSALDLSNTVTMNGSTTLELVYLP